MSTRINPFEPKVTQPAHFATKQEIERDIQTLIASTNLSTGSGFESWEWHMSPRVRTRHGEFTAELAWSGSSSRSGITPAVGGTVHPPPPPPN
ncbi:hypothetical protein Hanom_Chr02g00096601 [Helianthus anomalus]